jgi:hypothetical protein
MALCGLSIGVGLVLAVLLQSTAALVPCVLIGLYLLRRARFR